MSSGYEEPNESLATLQTLLSNPCAFEALKSGSDSTDNRRQRTFDNGDVKSALEQIAKAANTGLSDFKTTHLPNYVSNFLFHCYRCWNGSDKQFYPTVPITDHYGPAIAE